MLMIKDGYYAKFQELSDGSYVRSKSDINIEKVLLSGEIFCSGTLQEFKKDGWTPVKPTLETMTGGELLRVRDSYRFIFGRICGVGKNTIYVSSFICSNKNSPELNEPCSFATASGLKDQNYTIIDETKPKMTRAEAASKLNVEIVD